MLRKVGYSSKESDKFCRRSWDFINSMIEKKQEVQKSYKYGLTNEDIEMIERFTFKR